MATNSIGKDLAKLLNINYCLDDQQEDQWEVPIPLYNKYPVPFPTDIFSFPLKNYIEAEAEAIQTPVDLPGILALSVIASAVAKKYVIIVEDGWEEPLNIWTIIVLPPASRKSKVFADMVKPIEDFELQERNRIAPAIEEAKLNKRILEQSLQCAENEVAMSKGNNKKELELKAIEIAQKLRELEIPTAVQLIADDATPESVSSLMADQLGKIAILSSEGGDVFDLMAGRYSKSANLGNYLKAHSGDTIRVNRIGRKSEYIDKPALTMGLTIQPEVLNQLARKPGFRGRGLVARFLFSVPENLVGRRKIDVEPVPLEIKTDYQYLITKLLEISSKEKPLVGEMKLTKEAKSEFRIFLKWLEPQLGFGGDLSDIADWAGKLAGQVARVAGLLHLAKKVNSEHEHRGCEVEAATINAAIKLAKNYLIPHAKIAFAEMGADPDLEAAKYILDWIDRTKAESFTKRDLFNSIRGQTRFKNVKALDRPIDILKTHGYLKEKQLHRQGPGRTPSALFNVNPHTQNTQNTQN
ncbi:MAG: YfjI family protein [Dehalobacterium sp.]